MFSQERSCQSFFGRHELSQAGHVNPWDISDICVSQPIRNTKVVAWVGRPGTYRARIDILKLTEISSTVGRLLQ